MIEHSAMVTTASAFNIAPLLALLLSDLSFLR
jgi:hypothetical protein